MILVSKLPHAEELPLPHYQTSGAAGADVLAALLGPHTIAPGEILLVPTGLILTIPDGYEIQIRPRSGLASKHGIGIPNAPGTIDSDYRGEVMIALINWSKVPYVVSRGDRIAQFVLAKVERIAWQPVAAAEQLPPSARGDGGFGSTGMR